MLRRIGQITLTIIVMGASLPLALLAMNSGFGYSALLIVPTCCLGFWLSVTTKERAARIGWFVFASVVTFLLPLTPWMSGLLHSLQSNSEGIARELGPTVYNIVEMGGLALGLLLPGICCVLLGWLVAKTAMKTFGSTDESDLRKAEYRFTIRGMLLVMVVCCGLTAWLSSTVQHWRSKEQATQLLFLDQFKRSFTSGRIALRAEPRITEEFGLHSHLKQFRVTAAIVKNGEELWAQWIYWSDDNFPGSVLNYGYVESPTENGLPPFPIPEYLDEITNTSSLIDGEPKQNTTAKIVAVPTLAHHGTTIEFVAKSDQGMQCDLEINPFNSTKITPVQKIAPKSGIVSWELQLDPKYRGTKIQYIISCRTRLGYRANSVSGTISLIKCGDKQISNPNGE